MKSRLALATALALWTASSASAHRLDEYLQAAVLNMERERVEIDMHLTPGVEVFDKVLAAMDAAGDDAISAAKQRAYAEKLASDLTLSIDGVRVPLVLRSCAFPDVADMRQGVGEIALEFEGRIPPGGSRRTLVFENHHLPAISIYLANCLVPADPGIRITAQHRNYVQSKYRVDYEQAELPAASSPGQSPPPASWIERTGSESLFVAYFYQGVRHILTGYDHLLFVTALVLAATTLWDLIKVVATFTLAHTITLALAAMNLIHLPAWVVEPLIAASIVFVALQNVFWPRRAKGWSRLGAAFFFGLFHGLGFAGGLLDAMRELQGGTMFLSIAAFSIGVEAGHQMVVLPTFALLKAIRGACSDVVQRTRLSMAIQRIGSAGIAVAGVYYFIAAVFST